MAFSINGRHFYLNCYQNIRNYLNNPVSDKSPAKVMQIAAVEAYELGVHCAKGALVFYLAHVILGTFKQEVMSQICHGTQWFLIGVSTASFCLIPVFREMEKTFKNSQKPA